MLEDHVEGAAVHGSFIRPVGHEIPAPDPVVLESARLRLADRYVAPAGQLPVGPADDVRAVIAVTSAASGRDTNPADALDVGRAWSCSAICAPISTGSRPTCSMRPRTSA